MSIEEQHTCIDMHYEPSNGEAMKGQWTRGNVALAESAMIALLSHRECPLSNDCSHERGVVLPTR